MRIAFDLDGTLIPMPGSAMRLERLGIVSRLLSAEPLREGTSELFDRLRANGHEIWIYTTSLRSTGRLKLWLKVAGAPVAEVINQSRHEEAVRRGHVPRSCSKYPPAFGIELLIDDLAGVELEGKRYGFSVLRIDPGDDAWCGKVIGRTSAG
jgi:hypothetical protein